MKRKCEMEKELLNGMVLEYLFHQLTELRLKQANLHLTEVITLEEETLTYSKVIEIINMSEKLVTVIRVLMDRENISLDPLPQLSLRHYVTKCLNMVLGRGDEELNFERKLGNKFEGKKEKSTEVEKPTNVFLCRLHRDIQCKRCLGESSYFGKRSGLLQSIPLFLKVSQQIYEQVLDESEEEEIAVLSTWYDLFLELQTQAVLESWLCDKRNLNFVLENVFKYRVNPNSMLWRESKQLSVYFEECQERKQELLMLEEDSSSYPELVNRVNSTYPLKEFEVNLVNFLEVVYCRFEKPILIKYKEMANVDENIKELLHFISI
ncbi:hypothetical protein K7432_010831 [Basidiobolus ranarum]|uniref:Uncharacterized protein n=1 Tax=Basidiobolus ranarum TaxID=34480 RepID=A0ABR2WN80_9FUNG